MKSTLEALSFAILLATATSSQTGMVKSAGALVPGQNGFGGPTSSDVEFGAAIVRLGDLDGDGIDELAVGAPGKPTGSFAGAVWIVFPNPDGSVKAEQEIGNGKGGFGGSLAAADFFGASLAALGDLNGDGCPDLAVGAPGTWGNYGTSDGAVWILFLRPDGTVASEHLINEIGGGFPWTLKRSQFGHCMANAGDVDGDGVLDLAVGANNIGGSIWILFLNTDGTVRPIRRRINNDEGGAHKGLLGLSFGESVSGLGDLDGDGLQELAVGAPFYTPQVWIFHLAADGKVTSFERFGPFFGGSQVWTTPGPFGNALARLDDLDGDGVDELAVGSTTDDVWILFLDTDATVRGFQKLDEDSGNAPPEIGGRSLADLGDLDGDGEPTFASGVFVGLGTLELVHLLELDDAPFLPPVADFDWQWMYVTGSELRVDFRDRSANNVHAWSWDPGGGTIGSFPTEGPAMSFPPGSYVVTLTATGMGGTGSASKTVDIPAYGTSTVSNGSGVNPLCTSAPVPRIGVGWWVVVDTFLHPGAEFVLFTMYSAPGSGTFFRGWEILVDLTSPRLLSRFQAAQPYNKFNLGSVPASPSTAGMGWTVQGGLVDSALVLCNAVDVVVGL